MEGWIKTHRKIQEHWIYKEHRVFSKFEAWTDILLNVNHCEAKVFIKGTLFTVKRGDSINSLETWSKRWNWTKSKVRRFLELLQSDEMIVIKNEHKTTRLTVCNYDSYQDKRNADETQTKHRRNADETRVKPNKNEKNDNNDNNDNNIFSFRSSLISLCIDSVLVDEWLKVRKAKKAVNTETAFKGLVREINKSKLTPTKAIELAVENSWSGFKADWVNNQKPTAQVKQAPHAIGRKDFFADLNDD